MTFGRSSVTGRNLILSFSHVGVKISFAKGATEALGDFALLRSRRSDSTWRGPSLGAVAFLCLALCCVALAFGVTSAHSFELITKAEAKLPPDPTRTRGITRGPHVILVSPPRMAGEIYSPLRLQIEFKRRGNVPINTESVVVTYEKVPPIDLTQRLRPFIRPDGFEIDDATVPPGHHRIRVDVKDIDGRTGYLDFSFDVRKRG
jgi:hypothetical protein